MQCETLGAEGNRTFGKLVPIDYVKNLTSAQLTELLIPAEDEEDTESFRERYMTSFSTKAFGGNIEDYLDSTNGISGVGATKVSPVWAGGGTVKLTILDSQFQSASAELLHLVQQTTDPTKDGYGVGTAPIGHIVTVETVEEVPIFVVSNLVFESGYQFLVVEASLRESLESYFLSLRKQWADNELTVVRMAQIEALIMNTLGIEDLYSTSLNGVAGNLTLDSTQIPVLGGINCAS